MWRYQDTAASFGSTTWACQGPCRTFTHWRVLPGDALKVPAHDAPENWGRQEEWMSAIRLQRQRELQFARTQQIPQQGMIEGILRCSLKLDDIFKLGLFGGAMMLFLYNLFISDQWNDFEE